MRVTICRTRGGVKLLSASGSRPAPLHSAVRGGGFGHSMAALGKCEPRRARLERRRRCRLHQGREGQVKSIGGAQWSLRPAQSAAVALTWRTTRR